jgi:hypothetical protein
MKPDNTSAIPLEMEEARQQLEAWRSTHRPRCHIPDSLWKKAAELASQHGIYLTSRTLLVDYMRLKKLVGPASAERNNAELPRFVRTDGTSVGPHSGVRGGVGGSREKNANPGEGHGDGGVGGTEPNGVGGQVMIQITPQMRILVAIEAVDGRNYALSLDMRSFFDRAR